ncbi:MAG: aminotransferase class I/II-fold pyridoxal phosphate-dependent enzyme [Planctomycetota bacterium]
MSPPQPSSLKPHASSLSLDRLIARRMKRIDASGIRKVFDLAATMSNPLDLSIGQPDFDVSDRVKDAAVDAIRKGFNRYTQTQGIAELHERYRAFLKERKGYDPEAILVTGGVSGALLLALLALIDPGDEVVFPDPYFVGYKHLVNLVGGVPVTLDTYDTDFQLDPARLEEKLSPASKVLLLNSPSNPTGAVMRADVVKAVADIARRRGLFVISDEIYDGFVYLDETIPSIATLYEHTLQVGGLSKSHAFTGWRLGFACGPNALITEMAKIQQYTFVCAPSPVQKAAVVALDVDASDHFADYRRKRDLIYDALKDKFRVVKPEGAFYIFPAVPPGKGSDQDFVVRAIRNNVLVIPGSVFSERNTHFRIAYATSDETLLRAAQILNSLTS